MAESVSINENYTVTTESVYLLVANKNKCREFLLSNKLTPELISEFLISLHLVLEFSLNAFYRQIVLNRFHDPKEKIDVAKHLDRISFVEKTKSFLYMSCFVKENPNINIRHEEIISSLIGFSDIRNQLLHGAMIGESSSQKGNKFQTNAFGLLNEKILNTQIERFETIMTGLSYYLDNLHSKLTTSGKDHLKREYLDVTFLTINNEYLMIN